MQFEMQVDIFFIIRIWQIKKFDSNLVAIDLNLGLKFPFFISSLYKINKIQNFVCL